MRRASGLVVRVLAAAALALAGCASAPGPDDGTLTVFATTGHLADLVANVAPEAVVTTMVGPGGDPHTYQPSTRDMQRLHDADVVLWNGLHLEAQMTDQLQSLGDRQLAVGEAIPEDLLIAWTATDADGEPLHDPHIWNSPDAWTAVAREVAAHLSRLDPANAAAYRARAEDYVGRLDAAAAEAGALLDAIPPPRILVTGHDAFAYFGRSFDLDVRATDFISSEAVLSARELSDLATLIAAHRVPVIFHDNQASPQAITSLREAVSALGWHVRIADDPLYADSLGASPGVDTHLGAFRHNARTIADALTRPAR